MTFSAGPSNVSGLYHVVGVEVFGELSFNSTTATAGSAVIDFSLPVTTILNAAGSVIGTATFSNFAGQPITCSIIRSGTSGRIVKYDASNFALAANAITCQFRYRINDL